MFGRGLRLHSLVVHQALEAEHLTAAAALDDLIQPDERAAADEEDVRGVDPEQFLLGMLAPPLRRHARHRPFENLQQRLLHSLAGDVAGDRNVFRFAGDLVDLVDVDDADLGAGDVAVRRLIEPEQDILDILADVAGFSQRRRITDGERHVEQPRQSPRQQRLATAGRPEQKNVALVEFHVAEGFRRGVLVDPRLSLKAFVVVVHRDRQHLLRPLLPDHKLIEFRFDGGRIGNFEAGDRVRLLFLFLPGSFPFPAGTQGLIALPEAVGTDRQPLISALGEDHSGLIALPGAAEGADEFTVSPFGHRLFLLRRPGDHLVHQTVFDRIFGPHEEVPFSILLDPFDRLAGMGRDD